MIDGFTGEKEHVEKNSQKLIWQRKHTMLAHFIRGAQIVSGKGEKPNRLVKYVFVRLIIHRWVKLLMIIERGVGWWW